MLAVLVVCMSSKGRARLSKVVSAMSGLSACLSVLYLSSVVFSVVRHSFLLHDIIITLFDDMYFNLFFLGILMLLIAIMCWKLTRNISLQPTNHALHRSHLVWAAFLLLSVLTTGLCASMMSRVQREVEAEVGPRYKHGVSRYLESRDWQTAVDRIQHYLSCCGADSYTDWYTSTWIPLSLLPADPSVYSKVVQPNGQVLVPLTPTSCCRATSADCGHHAWLDAKNRSWSDIKAVDPQLLYSGGCTQAITFIVARDLLFFKIFLLMIAVLQVGMLVGSRYFYTCSFNSVILGRPEGRAPGWLIGPDIDLRFGENKGMTLDDYDKGCEDEELALIDGSRKQKKRWKCVDKIRGKTTRETDSDETQSPKSKIRFFQSPCFKKKGIKTQEQEKKYPHQVEPLSDRESENISDAIRVKFEEQEEAQYRAELHNKSPYNKSGSQIKRKLSRNLIDVEDESRNIFNNSAKKHVFDVATNQNYPFNSKEITGKPKSDDFQKRTMLRKSPSPRVHATAKQVEKSILQHNTGGPEIEQDFKTTRDLFESATKGETSDKSKGQIKQTQHPEHRYPVNLIDFVDPPDNKLNPYITMNFPASTQTNEEGSPLVTLRNYNWPSKV